MLDKLRISRPRIKSGAGSGLAEHDKHNNDFVFVFILQSFARSKNGGTLLYRGYLRIFAEIP